MPDQIFIYFRYTPKGLKMFASRDLNPMGDRKKYLSTSDPRAYDMEAVLNALICECRTHPQRHRPDVEKACIDAKRRVVGMFCQDMIFLPKQGEYGMRILVKFA